jgi:hypothetical protein
MYTTGQFTSTDKSLPGFYSSIKTRDLTRGYSPYGVVSIIAAVNTIPEWPIEGYIAVTASNKAQSLAGVIFEDDQVINSLISEILIYANTVIVHCVKSFDATKTSTTTKRYGAIFDDLTNTIAAHVTDAVDYNPATATLGPAGFRIVLERGKAENAQNTVDAYATMDDGVILTAQITNYTFSKDTPANNKFTLAFTIPKQIDTDTSSPTHGEEIPVQDGFPVGAPEYSFSVEVDLIQDLKIKKTYTVILGGVPSEQAKEDPNGYAYSMMMSYTDAETHTTKGQLKLRFSGSENKTGFNFIHIRGHKQGNRITLYRSDFSPIFNVTAIKDAKFDDTYKTIGDIIPLLQMDDTLEIIGENVGTAGHFNQPLDNVSYYIPLVFGHTQKSFNETLQSFIDNMQHHNAAIAYITQWPDEITTDNYTLAVKKKAYQDVQMKILKRIIELDLPTQLLMDEDRLPLVHSTTPAENETEITALTLNHPYLISMRSGSHGTNGHSMMLGAWVAGALAGCNPQESIMARKYDGSIAKYRATLNQKDIEKTDELGLLVFHQELGVPMIYLDRSAFITVERIPNDVGDVVKYPPSFRRNQVVRVANTVKSEIRSLFLTKYITRTLDGLTIMSLQGDVINILNSIATTGAIQRPEADDVSAEKLGPVSVLVKTRLVINQTLEILYLEMEV